MDELSLSLRNGLKRRGAALVGYGGLSAIPADARQGLPVGVSVAVVYPKEIIRGIADLPTPAYSDWYYRLNDLLDGLVTGGADFLRARGYRALAQTREYVRANKTTYLDSLLPHKTVATRAGLGWIGRCALLVTPEFGSMVRLSSILTDAPLATNAPIDKSRCGGCMACARACPGGAVSGVLWTPGTPRELLYNAEKCRITALERARLGIGALDGEELCGRCIAACPHTLRYLDAS